MTFDNTFHSRFVYMLLAIKTRGNSVTEFFFIVLLPQGNLNVEDKQLIHM